MKNQFNKFKAAIKYEKEDIAQVNPQLLKWLRSINAKSSANRIAHDLEIVKEEDENIPYSDRDSYAPTLRKKKRTLYIGRFLCYN